LTLTPQGLRHKRELHKAIQAGHDAHDAELVAHQALELAYRTVWVLTNDRGARVGKIAHDPRRSALIPLVRKTPSRRLELWRLLSDLEAAHSEPPGHVHGSVGAYTVTSPSRIAGPPVLADGRRRGRKGGRTAGGP
jgi:hypothetical protein